MLNLIADICVPDSCILREPFSLDENHIDRFEKILICYFSRSLEVYFFHTVCLAMNN